MSYSHEREKPKSQSFNTVWPEVATDNYADHWFREYLKSRRLDFETAYLAGIYPSHMDCLRVVLPCVSLKEGHAYYQARAISPKIKLRYVSPYGQRHGALCCIDAVKEHSPFIVVVEGPMDALALASCGVDSIALMGISPDRETVSHLVSRIKKESRPVVIMFDNEDEAQRNASKLAVDLACQGIACRVCTPKSKDFAASSNSERQEYIKEFNKWAKQSRLSITSLEKHRKTLA